MKHSGNNKLLANVKRLFNTRIYAKARLILNQEGEEKALAYVLSLYRPEYRAEAEAELRK